MLLKTIKVSIIGLFTFSLCTAEEEIRITESQVRPVLKLHFFSPTPGNEEERVTNCTKVEKYADMEQCFSNRAAFTDKVLNAVYDCFLETSRTDEYKDSNGEFFNKSGSNLRSAQIAWAKFKDEYCVAQSQVGVTGGTYARVNRKGCIATKSIERIKDLLALEPGLFQGNVCTTKTNYQFKRKVQRDDSNFSGQRIVTTENISNDLDILGIDPIPYEEGAF